MCKYLILGNGFLGNRFYNYFRYNREDVILSNERIGPIATSKEIKFLIAKYQPEIVINAIGKTGRPNVDWCQNHKEETFFSNVTIPAFIAEVCNDANIRMVHIGSGCIYEGINEQNPEKGFRELDNPNFTGSFYSKTKIYSEQILSRYKNILQLRIRMPIDNRPGDRNLIDKLLKYNKVIDEQNSVTYIQDFLKIATELINRKETGIFNIVNQESIGHKEILLLYKQIVDPEFKMPKFIDINELYTIAGRSNCILSTKKLEDIGISVRDIREAIKECMYIYKQNMGR